MKDNKTLYGIIGIVALAVVDVIIYLFVKEYTIARWINIAGLNLSIIVFWASGIMFGEKDKRFLEYTRLPIVTVYSVITFIVSAIMVMFGVKSVPVSIAIQILFLGALIIALATNTMANNTSNEITEKDTSNYNKIADMSKRIELIMQMVDNRDIYKKIEKTYDAVKNARVTVSANSREIDNDIMQTIGVLEANVQNSNFDAIDEQLTKINNAILKRNQM